MNQVTIEGIDPFLPRSSHRRKSKLEDDRLQQFILGEEGVKEDGSLYLFVQPSQDRPAGRRLSRADIPRKDHKSLSLVDAIEKRFDGCAMALAQIEKLGIRRKGKGFFSETIKFFVHGRHCYF